MFSDADVLKGEAARDVTSNIQKWNVVAPRFYPILVANARVDWLGLKDDEITKQFHTLLEGILQDVFAQRASAAWQGAKAQKLTVSLLLPGEGTAAQWRDFLQSKRRLWPTLSHRYTALTPLQEKVLQRERRHMRAKHLWDYIDIDWYELDRKLKVAEPTGLPRQYIWDLLFVIKHRQNPYQEAKYNGWDYKEVKKRWESTKETFAGYRGQNCLAGINTADAIKQFNINNEAALNTVNAAKALHARRWQTKEGTFRIKSHTLPDVRDRQDGRDVRENAAASPGDTVHLSHWGTEYSYMDY